MSEVEEFFQVKRGVDQTLIFAGVLLSISTAAFAWAFLGESFPPLVLGTFFLTLTYISASRATATMRAGYNRVVWKWVDDPTYPPLNEWEESLEERGEFTEFDWWRENI